VAFDDALYDAITVSVAVSREDIRDLAVTASNADIYTNVWAVDGNSARKLRGAQQQPVLSEAVQARVVPEDTTRELEASKEPHTEYANLTPGSSGPESDPAVPLANRSVKSADAASLENSTAAEAAEEAANRRRASSGDGLLGIGESVWFSYSIVISGEERTFEDLQEQLLQSVRSGAFDVALEQRAIWYGVPALAAGNTSVVSTENIPPGDNDGESGGSSALTLPVVVGVTVGAGAIIGVAVTLMYFYCCRGGPGEPFHSVVL
jgi:hypothetical protein